MRFPSAGPQLWQTQHAKSCTVSLFIFCTIQPGSSLPVMSMLRFFALVTHLHVTGQENLLSVLAYHLPPPPLSPSIQGLHCLPRCSCLFLCNTVKQMVQGRWCGCLHWHLRLSVRLMNAAIVGCICRWGRCIGRHAMRLGGFAPFVLEAMLMHMLTMLGNAWSAKVGLDCQPVLDWTGVVSLMPAVHRHPVHEQPC